MTKKRAFTLIELVVSMAIISVLALLVSTIFSFAMKSSKEIYEDDFYNKEAVNAMLLIENIVRESEQIRENNDINENFCNFRASFRNKDGELTDYVFFVRDENLMANVIKGNGSVTNFGKVKDISLFYDKKDCIEIEIVSLSGDVYKSLINLGKRNEKESLH